MRVTKILTCVLILSNVLLVHAENKKNIIHEREQEQEQCITQLTSLGVGGFENRYGGDRHNVICEDLYQRFGGISESILNQFIDCTAMTKKVFLNSHSMYLRDSIGLRAARACIDSRGDFASASACIEALSKQRIGARPQFEKAELYCKYHNQETRNLLKQCISTLESMGFETYHGIIICGSLGYGYYEDFDLKAKIIRENIACYNNLHADGAFTSSLSQTEKENKISDCKEQIKKRKLVDAVAE